MTADQRRRAVAPSGAQKDLKIHRFDQIPTGPLAELAARYGIGDIKYGQKDGLDNWRHGMPWSWSYRALIGHANDFWAGESVDEMAYLGTDDESAFDEDGDPRPGVQHLAAVAWHAFALLEWMTTHPENDDRPSTVQRRLAAGLAGSEDDDEADDEDDFTGPHDGRVFIAPLASDIALPAGWQDVGYVNDARTVFTNASLETIELAVDAEPGSLFSQLQDGQPFVTQSVQDGRYVRTVVPNPTYSPGDTPGSVKVTPRPAPERPLAIGTRVYTTSNEAWGIITKATQAGPVEGTSIGYIPAYYRYEITLDPERNEWDGPVLAPVIVEAVRDDLLVKA